MLGAVVVRRSSRRAAERAASAAESLLLLLPRSSDRGAGRNAAAAAASSSLASRPFSAPSGHYQHLRHFCALWQQQSASFAAKTAAAAPRQRRPRPTAAAGSGGGGDEPEEEEEEDDDDGSERASSAPSPASSPFSTPRVRLVRPDGTHAVVSRAAAAREAKAAGLDLVPVRSARADPPVFRLAALDAEAAAARAREKHKRERHLAARRREETKEVRVSVRSERHDAETRLRRCRELVAKGWRVRLVVPVERPDRRALQAAQAADAAAEASGSARGGGKKPGGGGWGNRRNGGRNNDGDDGERSHRDTLLGGLRSAALGRLRELRVEAEEFADVSSPDADSGAKPRGPGGGAVVWALLSPRDGGARR